MEDIRSAITSAVLLAAPIVAGIIVCHVASWAYGLCMLGA
jgi:hypothetical protein